MATKTVFQPYRPEAVTALGITDDRYYGIPIASGHRIETVLITESEYMYDKLRKTLSTETTSQLSSLKRAFILPLCNISQDRIKAALKEHNITVTNDYELADCIITHEGFHRRLQSGESIPSTACLLHLSNYSTNVTLTTGISLYHAETGNDVFLDDKCAPGNSRWRVATLSAPYDSYAISGLAIELGEKIQNNELQVVSVETVLHSSANVTDLTEELIESLESMLNSHDAENLAVVSSILPTIEATKFPWLMYKLAQTIGHSENRFSRQKDVLYWWAKSEISRLYVCSAEEAIQFFEERDLLDKHTFRMLEPICRKQIDIYNRSLYTFTVQVKPEYRHLLTD